MPFDDLDCDGLHGIELWSFVTDTAEDIESVSDALRFVLAPGRFVRHPPHTNMATWDRLCRTRRTVAIGGLDAHQFGRRVGPVVLRLMGYRRSFRHLRTHVLCREPLTRELDHDREQIYDALRQGRCYLSMDSVAPGRGFSFWGEGPDRALTMGAEATGGDWTLRATLPAPAELRLLRDGAEAARLHGSELERPAEGPGVYRVEATRRARGAERTWIISNPIYLRERL